VNIFVAGSFVFGNNKNYAERITALRMAAEGGMAEIDKKE
jgi:hypothetical protein